MEKYTVERERVKTSVVIAIVSSTKEGKNGKIICRDVNFVSLL